MRTTLNARNAAREPFLATLRALVRAFQAFSRCDAEHLERFGLTSGQADVLFTLGNTEGMTFKEIGERTLITKGTLTGIIDRLVRKDLVRRVDVPNDGRSTLVVLTAKGNQWFERVFPQHIGYMKRRFEKLSGAELRQAEVALRKLKEIF